MRIQHYLIAAVFAVNLLSGCKKEREPEKTPEITLSVKEDALQGALNEKLVFSASITSGKNIKHEWKLNGEVGSNTTYYEFVPHKSGIYVITYTAVNGTGTFSHTYTVNVATPVIPIGPGSSKFVSTLFDYLPAPGQFVNTSIANLDAAKTILGKSGSVSLGAWGGYIVLGFDHTVVNKTDAPDFMITGNPLPTLAEPGIIWAMQDENGNGKPDDTWYEVAGSEFGKEGYIRDYEVTYTKPNPITADVPWKDNKGKTGVVKTNIYHRQSYYPEWVTTNEYTLKGSLLPYTNINMTNPANITSIAFDWGYADSSSGGDAIDIANAIDKDGKKVVLKGIDFVKVQTGLQANMGWLGELSTEVFSVYDLNMGK